MLMVPLDNTIFMNIPTYKDKKSPAGINRGLNSYSRIFFELFDGISKFKKVNHSPDQALFIEIVKYIKSCILGHACSSILRLSQETRENMFFKIFENFFAGIKSKHGCRCGYRCRHGCRSNWETLLDVDADANAKGDRISIQHHWYFCVFMSLCS